MVKIKFLGNFREITGEKEKEMEYNGNLEDFLEILARDYDSKFKDALFDKERNIKDYMKILINGEDLKSKKFKECLLKDDDQVVIFQTIAGG
jgi:molybdopterin synthase sulfur carrier subunit